MRRTELLKKLLHPNCPKNYKVYTPFAVINSLRTFSWNGSGSFEYVDHLIFHHQSVSTPTNSKQFFRTLVCAIVKQCVLRIMKYNCSVDLD